LGHRGGALNGCLAMRNDGGAQAPAKDG
jgi:hypothetical protein